MYLIIYFLVKLNKEVVFYHFSSLYSICYCPKHGNISMFKKFGDADIVLL